MSRDSLATRGQRATRFARTLVGLGGAMALGRPRPFSMTFILTHRCNFKCVYCNIPAAAGDEMTTDEFRRAIDELVEVGLARASFSGGEALLRPDALDIIAHARSRGLVTSLNSNAWLAGARLDALADVLDMLVISLDGGREMHDRQRRRPGSFDRVVDVLRAARGRGLATATITVLSAENLHVVEEVVRVTTELGAWAYFQPAYDDCFQHERGVDPSFGPKIFADLADRLSRARASGARVGASEGFLERLAQGPTFGDCGRCNAGRYFGTVMPDGVVVPCHLTSGDHTYPNGRAIGFGRAFLELPRPKPGPGCAISPYQETDLIFGLDTRAITAAARRLTR